MAGYSSTWWRRGGVLVAPDADGIDNRLDGDANAAEAGWMLVLERADVEALLDLEDPRVRPRSR